MIQEFTLSTNMPQIFTRSMEMGSDQCRDEVWMQMEI